MADVYTILSEKPLNSRAKNQLNILNLQIFYTMQGISGMLERDHLSGQRSVSPQ